MKTTKVTIRGLMSKMEDKGGNAFIARCLGDH